MTLRITNLCDNLVARLGYTGEWGLSMLVEFGTTSVLLDAGHTRTAVANARRRGIDLKRITQIVLSHGHKDHTGGLRQMLESIDQPVDVILHPEAWRPKYASREGQNDPQMQFVGMPYSREALEDLGARFIEQTTPHWITPDLVTSGEIPMVTAFERIDENLFIKGASGFVPDPLADDQALFVKSPKGLVVLMGCAHRGVINTLLHAREVTGVDQVYAVLGGIHLFRAGQEQIQKTIAHLADFGIERIGASHCTGMPAAMTLAERFGEQFFFNAAGNVTQI